MRLQLITATALTIAPMALAGGRVSTRVDVYTDEFIEVVAPSVSGAWETEKVSVEGRYAADILSGATQVLSADLVTSATHFEEVRHQVGLSASWQPKPGQTLSGYQEFSIQPDYLTNAAGLSYSQDLFGRMSTLAVGYGISLERMGMSDNPAFEEWTHAHRLDLSWTQILTKTTARLTGYAAFCGEQVGCLANPYRFVAVISDGTTALAVRERNPDRIFRGAGSLRLSQALGRTTAVHAGYRGYLDTWQVHGHTWDLAVNQQLFHEQLMVSVDGRVSTQSAASFFRDDYQYTASNELVTPEYRSLDRELSGLFTGSVGGRLDWTFFSVGKLSTIGLNARLSRHWFLYPNFSELPERSAWLGGGGIDGTF